MAFIPGVLQRTIYFDYTLFAGATGDVADRDIGEPFAADGSDLFLFAFFHVGDFWDGIGIGAADITIRQTGSSFHGFVGGEAHISHDNTNGNSYFPQGTPLTQLIAHLDVSGGDLTTLASGQCWVTILYAKGSL